MSNQLYLQSSPKLFGTVFLSAFISYAGWWALENFIFKDPNTSNLNKMLRWFSSGPPKLLQDPETIYEVPLVEREQVSHDTRRFRFGLPSKDHVLGLPIGKHVHLFATIDGSEVKRAYTPVSSDDDKGYVEFVIKVYFKNVHPRFPDGGKMSQHLESLKIGDTIKIRGPSGRLEYHGQGNIVIKETKDSPIKKRQVKQLSMVAGGTGIAPMLQVIRHVLKKNDDSTKISLLFANQSEKDILLRNELEAEAAKFPDQLKIWYTIDRAEEGWKYSTGFVGKDMIKEHLYAADNDDTMILLCGPPPMIKHVNSQLDELDWPMENRFKY